LDISKICLRQICTQYTIALHAQRQRLQFLHYKPLHSSGQDFFAVMERKIHDFLDKTSSSPYQSSASSY
jgi:hypothetical protein